jgi:flagellin-like protein
MKGISPLIASVVLIAVTLAIAGVLTTWLWGYFPQQTTTIQLRTECMGALSAEPATFSNGITKVIVRNMKSSINLTDLRAFWYIGGVPTPSPTSYATNQSLGPFEAIQLTLPTGQKPEKVEIWATNCGAEFKVSTAVS